MGLTYYFAQIPEKYYGYADQFHHLVAEIRALPGFECFLMRPADSKFMKTAQEGAIVVFSVSVGRGDDVIFTKDQIRSLFLPDLTDVNVKENVHRLHMIIENRGPQEYRATKSEMISSPHNVTEGTSPDWRRGLD
jgi:hypothetical protein